MPVREKIEILKQIKMETLYVSDIYGTMAGARGNGSIVNFMTENICEMPGLFTAQHSDSGIRHRVRALSLL